MMKRTMVGIASLLALFFGLAVHAVESTVQGKVVRTLSLDDGVAGGCLIQLDQDWRDSASSMNCGSPRLTLSCSGNADQEAFTNRDDAYRKFDMTQMAFALNKQVRLTVTDDMKHGVYCFAKRVEVIN